MAAGPVDMELKKAFQDLQMKMIDTTKRLRQADLRIEALRRAVKYAYCTGELVSEDPGAKMYRSCGRIKFVRITLEKRLHAVGIEVSDHKEVVVKRFLGTDFSEVMKHLDDKINGWNERIKGLENHKDYLQKNLKESENNLREMIVQKQSMH